jgi:hypothetical protein
MNLGALITLLKLAQDAEIAQPSKPTTRYTRVAVAKGKIYDIPEYVAKKIEF